MTKKKFISNSNDKKDHSFTGPGECWVPFTPGGSSLFDLRAQTKQKAIDNLLRKASHMPYQGWSDFYDRGYRVEKVYQVE